MDLVAADLYNFTPITQGITGDGTNTHGSGSPGAGVLNIHLGAGGVLHHQGSRGTGIGRGRAVGLQNFDFIAVSLIDGIPADLQSVLQGCDIAGVIEASVGNGGNADGCFRLTGGGRFGGGGILPVVPLARPGLGGSCGGAVIGEGGNRQGHCDGQNHDDRENFLHKRYSFMCRYGLLI